MDIIKEYVFKDCEVVFREEQVNVRKCYSHPVIMCSRNVVEHIYT